MSPVQRNSTAQGITSTHVEIEHILKFRPPLINPSRAVTTLSQPLAQRSVMTVECLASLQGVVSPSKLCNPLPGKVTFVASYI